MRSHGIHIFGSQEEFPGTFTIGMSEDKVKETIKKVADKLDVSDSLDMTSNFNVNRHEYWFSSSCGDKAYFTCENGKLSEIEMPTWMAKEKFISNYTADIDKHIGCIIGFSNLIGTEVLSEELRKRFKENFSEMVGDNLVLLDQEEKIVHILYEYWPELMLRISKYENKPELYNNLELGDYKINDDKLVIPEIKAFEVDFDSFDVDWNNLINNLE